MKFFTFFVLLASSEAFLSQQKCEDTIKGMLCLKFQKKHFVMCKKTSTITVSQNIACLSDTEHCSKVIDMCRSYFQATETTTPTTTMRATTATKKTTPTTTMRATTATKATTPTTTMRATTATKATTPTTTMRATTATKATPPTTTIKVTTATKATPPTTTIKVTTATKATPPTTTAQVKTATVTQSEMIHSTAFGRFLLDGIYKDFSHLLVGIPDSSKSVQFTLETSPATKKTEKVTESTVKVTESTVDKAEVPTTFQEVKIIFFYTVAV
jgi:hypothetical protein